MPDRHRGLEGISEPIAPRTAARVVRQRLSSAVVGGGGAGHRRTERHPARLDRVPRVAAPIVWSHSVLVTLLADSDTGTLEFEQKMVETSAMEGDPGGQPRARRANGRCLLQCPQRERWLSTNSAESAPTSAGGQGFSWSCPVIGSALASTRGSVATMRLGAVSRAIRNPRRRLRAHRRTAPADRLLSRSPARHREIAVTGQPLGLDQHRLQVAHGDPRCGARDWRMLEILNAPDRMLLDVGKGIGLATASQHRGKASRWFRDGACENSCHPQVVSLRSRSSCVFRHDPLLSTRSWLRERPEQSLRCWVRG
jgi:hypothetical protein